MYEANLASCAAVCDVIHQLGVHVKWHSLIYSLC